MAMAPIVILSILVIVIFGFMLVYIIRMVLVPQKLSQVEKMIKNKHYSGAIKLAKQLIVKRSNAALLPKLHVLLAEAYMGTGNAPMAIVEYRTALRDTKREPLSFEVKVRKRLAELFIETKKQEEALKELLTLAKVDPNNPEHFFKVGKIYYDNNMLDKAAGFLTKTIEINQQFGEAYALLGLTKYKQNREGEALDALIKSLKFDPKNANTHYHMGRIYRNSKDYAKALEEFEYSTRDQSLRAPSLLERGLCYIETGNYIKGVIELEQALKEPAKSEAVGLAIRYALARCYEETRDLSSAIEQWERINQVNPNYRDVADKLRTYAELRHDDALKDFLTANAAVYEETCKKVIAASEMKIIDFWSERNGDMSALARESDEVKWRNSKLMTRLYRIRRDNSNKVQEQDIRELLEAAKRKNAARAVYVTSSRYSEQAVAFANSRPVDLIDVHGLQELLKKAQSIKETPSQEQPRNEE